MKKIKTTLATLLLLGIVGFIFFAYSATGWLTEFDDAFFFIEGQESFVSVSYTHLTLPTMQVE